MASYHPLSKARGVACKWGPQLALLPALRPPRPTGLLLASYICLPCARSLERIFLLCLVGLINTHSSFKSQLEEHLLNETNVPKAPERTSHFPFVSPLYPAHPSTIANLLCPKSPDQGTKSYSSFPLQCITCNACAMHIKCMCIFSLQR